MGYIYRIYLIENGKSYIGQTIFPVEVRMKQHVYNAYNKDSASYNQHLKRAIRKYGEDAFTVEVLEQCDNSLLDEREKYWIAHFDSLKHGFNMTYGGEGKVEHDGRMLLEAWNEGMNMSEISEKYKICWKSVSNHLKAQGITDGEIRARRYTSAMNKRKRPVYQYDEKGNYIAEYPSIPDFERQYGCNTIYNAVDKGRLAVGYLWSYTKAERIEPYCNHRKKPVYQYSKSGVYIRSFESVVDAAKEVGTQPSTITDAICGIKKSCRGYLWRHEKVDRLPVLQSSLFQ